MSSTPAVNITSSAIRAGSRRSSEGAPRFPWLWQDVSLHGPHEGITSHSVVHLPDAARLLEVTADASVVIKSEQHTEVSTVLGEQANANSVGIEARVSGMLARPTSLLARPTGILARPPDILARPTGMLARPTAVQSSELKAHGKASAVVQVLQEFKLVNCKPFILTPFS
jgi:hypothetical protein